MRRALLAILIALAVDAHGETYHQHTRLRQLMIDGARIVDGFEPGHRTWSVGALSGSWEAGALRKRGRRITFTVPGVFLDCTTVRGTRWTQTGTVRETESDGAVREQNSWSLSTVGVVCNLGAGRYDDSRADLRFTERTSP